MAFLLVLLRDDDQGNDFGASRLPHPAAMAQGPISFLAEATRALRR